MEISTDTTPGGATDATCPVCGWDVSAGGQDVRVEEITVRVCSDECARVFALAPTRYLRRR